MILRLGLDKLCDLPRDASCIPRFPRAVLWFVDMRHVMGPRQAGDRTRTGRPLRALQSQPKYPAHFSTLKPGFRGSCRSTTVQLSCFLYNASATHYHHRSVRVGVRPQPLFINTDIRCDVYSTNKQLYYKQNQGARVYDV